MKRVSVLLASVATLAVFGIAAVVGVAAASPTSSSTPSTGPTASGVPITLDPHKVTRVSPAQAQSAVEKLLAPGNHKTKYLGTKDRSGIRAHAFSGTDFDALVDVSDGHVTMLTIHSAVPATIPPTVPNLAKGQAPAAEPIQAVAPQITANRAVAIATDYLASIGSPTQGLTVSVRSTTGSGTPGYTVSFQRFAGDTVLPDYRLVEVDASTGTVFSLIDVRRPYVDPGTPHVSLADATRYAVTAAGGGVPRESHLVLWFDAAGTQRLVWEIEVRAANADVPGTALAPSQIEMIDALTGQMINPAQ